VEDTCHIGEEHVTIAPSYTAPSTLPTQSLFAPGQVITAGVSNDELVFATQMLLNALGHLKESPSTRMTKAASAAIGRFQVERSLRATGIPSGRLLVSLSNEVMRRHGTGAVELSAEPAGSKSPPPESAAPFTSTRQRDELERAERAATSLKEQNQKRVTVVVRSWYDQKYAPAMAAFRFAAADFGEALTSSDAEKRARYADSCAQLSMSISPARVGIGRSGVSPLDDALGAVFLAYSKMAQHCSQGHARETADAMAAARASFAHLQFELAKYGLTP
jgi:hypothetical protein